MISLPKVAALTSLALLTAAQAQAVTVVYVGDVVAHEEFIAENEEIDRYVIMDQVIFSTSGGLTTLDFFGYGFGVATNEPDLYMALFSYDGSLTTSDYLSESDDDTGEQGFDDGSISSLDPYLSTTLASGTYLAMIGLCCDYYGLDPQTFITGYQGTPVDGTIRTYGYQLSITGENVVFETNPSEPQLPAVPLPAGLPLLGSALLAGAALRKRRR
mgnify:CR=1 FL=1